MNISIIGLGSMGKMLAEKFTGSGKVPADRLFIANRSAEKLSAFEGRAVICRTNGEAAASADVLFLCVRPVDMKTVLNGIKSSLRADTFVISLNASIPFGLLEQHLPDYRIAKVIPSVTAEIDRSQTLVCYNNKVTANDKSMLSDLLACMGKVYELPEAELGMGSELVSCMPGFIAAVFDVICASAGKHTSLPKEQITEMVLGTVNATSELMQKKSMSFSDVVDRVATKGGITEEGTSVIYRGLPATADEMFEKTLEKRRLTAEKAKELLI
jgi:pyrroline-5-carboxylate reductase